MTEKSMRLIGEADVVALATDGSSYTDGAVQEAIFLAQACGAKLVVLHVIPLDSESAMGICAFSDAMRREITDPLERIRKIAEDSEVPCSVVIEESFHPDKAIVDLAYRHQADILLMGRHGKRALLKLLVGNMTAKVIGHKFPRVLVVPNDCTISGERVLIAVDGSDASSIAADEVISMGINCTTLKEVHVLSVSSSESGLDQAEALTEMICEAGRKHAPHVAFLPLALVGKHAADIITAAAVEKHADMILIGGHGKGLTKLLMGHVTEKVIGKARCPVLVLEKRRE